MNKQKLINIIISAVVSVVFYYFIEGPGAITMSIYGLLVVLNLENSSISTELLYLGYILLSILVFCLVLRFLNKKYITQPSPNE